MSVPIGWELTLATTTSTAHRCGSVILIVIYHIVRARERCPATFTNSIIAAISSLIPAGRARICIFTTSSNQSILIDSLRRLQVIKVEIVITGGADGLLANVLVRKVHKPCRTVTNAFFCEARTNCGTDDVIAAPRNAIIVVSIPV